MQNQTAQTAETYRTLSVTRPAAQMIVLGSASLLALNLWLHLTWLGVAVALVWLYFAAKTLAVRLSLDSIPLGFVSILSLLSIGGGLLYLIWAINTATILLLIAMVTVLSLLWVTQFTVKAPTLPPLKKVLFDITYLALVASSALVLWQARTAEALRSPWDVVPKYFWLLALAATCLLLLRTKYNGYSAALTSLHVALTCGVALLIYQVGYGYDPFIHLATEKYISLHGFITPKKIYYLGQYAPIVFLHRTTALSLEFLNAMFVPFLATLLLPTTASLVLKRFERTDLTPLLLALPVGTFIMTTPQNLGNLYLILGTGLSLAGKQYLPVLWTITAGALITQPISGIPLLGLALLTWAQNSQSAKKLLLAMLGILVSLAGLVAAFTALSLTTPYHIAFKFAAISWQNLLPYKFMLGPALTGLLGGVYAYQGLLLPLLVILAGFGAWYIKSRGGSTTPVLIMVGGLLFNAWLLAGVIEFPFLIQYERLDFAKRLTEQSALVLMPLALVALAQVKLKTFTHTLVYMLIGSGVLTASLYLSYPANDRFVRTKGFSVSTHDFSAVTTIARDAGERTYVVLANQNLGAAALASTGFIPHYVGPDGIEQYLYSIPTGGNLYQAFYNIAEKQENVATNITRVFTDYPVNSV